MGCCSSTDAGQFVPELSTQTDQSADRLAALLAQTPEYQEFLRLSRLIRLDPDVRRLSIEIQKHQKYYGDPSGESVETLEEELEALPAVQTYRKAETAVRALFHTVDQIISAGAGVAFAPNAIKSGCG